MNIPWLSKSYIADQAALIIDRFRLSPPINVEELIELEYGLNLSYEDLDEKYGERGILGELSVASETVTINQSLCDAEGQEGRINFTAAHELGHWILHRRYVSEMNRRAGVRDFILCRKANKSEKIEWQANYFASSLIMPEEFLRDTFRETFGDAPLVIYNEKSCFSNHQLFDPCAQRWPQIASTICQFGGFSNVSKQAMIIRLQDLGLVVNKSNAHIGWKQQRLF